MLADQVDRAFVINLAERQDRISAFYESARKSRLLNSLLDQGRLHRFEALSPSSCAAPTWFAGGRGNRNANKWCCRESHLRLWEQCIIGQISHALIFEDDAVIYDNFDRRFEDFLQSLPADWIGYQIGGHARSTDRLSDTCYRLKSAGGLHAYGLNLLGLRTFYAHVARYDGDVVDSAVSSLYGRDARFFCPQNWFVGLLDDFSNNEQKAMRWGARYRPPRGFNW